MSQHYIVPQGYENLQHNFTVLSQQFTQCVVSQSYNNLLSNKDEDPHFFNRIERLFPVFQSLKDFLSADHTSIVCELIDNLVHLADENTSNQVITPWTIEMHKQDQKDLPFDLYGPIRTHLPVIIKGCNEECTMELSEEIMFGILSVTNRSDKFTFYLKDANNAPIILEDVMDNYLLTKQKHKKQYTANIFIGEITFDTLDVIQGILFGALLIGFEPYEHINNVKHNDVPVIF